MLGLIEVEKGKFMWNLSIGNEYFLGYHHGYSPICKGEAVHGFFFGYDEGKSVFYQEKDGKVFSYFGHRSEPATWHGDCGDDEPCFPGVKTSFKGEITNTLDKKLILEYILRFKK